MRVVFDTIVDPSVGLAGSDHHRNGHWLSKPEYKVLIARRIDTKNLYHKFMPYLTISQLISPYLPKS